MKNLIKKGVLLSILTASLFITSCKKKESATTNAAAKGTLYFNINTFINSTGVAAGQIAMDAAHRHFKLNIAQFYISGIVLNNSNGASFACSGVYLLKTIANQMFFVDSVTAGNYTSISFNVGIDSVTNTKVPTAFISSSVLYTQNPSMFFSIPGQGYMFMNVQGIADTMSADTVTTINNAHVNYPFTFELGADTAIRTIKMLAQPITITAGTANYFNIIADYGKLFQGIDFSSFSITTGIVTPWTNPAICSQINANIPNMFR